MNGSHIPADVSADAILLNRIPCEWLSTNEAARYLSMTTNALRIRVHRGQVRAYKIGRSLRFRIAELDRALLKKGA